MQKCRIICWQNLLLAFAFSMVGYMILLLTKRTGLVDLSIEAFLFFWGSIVAFRGFIKSNKDVDKNFRMFELFYGTTYFLVVISFIIGIFYLVNNPDILEIGVADVVGNYLLIIMSLIKSLSMIFLILTWICFYRHLGIKSNKNKKIAIFLTGLLLYFSASFIIWKLTGDINVLSLGVIVGSIIGIFSLIAQDKKTKYLTIIFILYSCIHLIEFYLMGIGNTLTTGLNNPVYWGVTVLYILEVKRWIDDEQTTKIIV